MTLSKEILNKIRDSITVQKSYKFYERNLPLNIRIYEEDDYTVIEPNIRYIGLLLDLKDFDNLIIKRGLGAKCVIYTGNNCTIYGSFHDYLKTKNNCAVYSKVDYYARKFNLGDNCELNVKLYNNTELHKTPYISKNDFNMSLDSSNNIKITYDNPLVDIKFKKMYNNYRQD